MNMSDLDRKYLKKMLIALAVAFIPSEIVTHILRSFISGPYWDVLIAAIVPGALLTALFYVGGKYAKEKENMLDM